jgi:hypothetical protein
MVQVLTSETEDRNQITEDRNQRTEDREYGFANEVMMKESVP